MSTTPAGKLTSTFRVGSFVCDLAYGPDGLSAQWSPTMPRKLAQWEMAQYYRGRNALLAEVSKAIGGAVLVLEA